MRYACPPSSQKDYWQERFPGNVISKQNLIVFCQKIVREVLQEKTEAILEGIPPALGA
jgi:hypothetical protein